MPLDSALGLPGQRPGVVTSVTRPVNPFVGQMIVETDTGRLMVYTSSGEWRQATTGTEVTATPPGGAITGDLWFDNESAAMYCYYDGFWVEVTGVASTEVADGQITSAKLASDVTTTHYGKVFYDSFPAAVDNSSGAATYQTLTDMTTASGESSMSWNVATGEWTIPVDGVYAVEFITKMGDGSTYGDLNVRVDVNGTQAGTTLTGFGTNDTVSEKWLLPLSANDLVSFVYRGQMLYPRANIYKISVG